MDTPTPPSPTVQALSAVDCYTCRRRRVRCDRVLPGCAKCARTQLDCLGYKKPLVWNKGVASRGKMMGKTFPVPTPPQSQSQSQFKSVGKEKIPKSRRIVHYEPAQSTVVGVIAGPSPIEAAGSEEEEEVDRSGVEMEVWSEGEASSYASSYGAPSPDSYGPSSENSFQMVRSTSNNIKYSLSEIKPSVFVDLDSTGRYYLDYFDKRVCRDFILFEKECDNPYRNLLPMAAENPPFLHAALAVAARHHSNNCNFPETHALVYKGRAYKHLYNALQTQTAGGVTEPVLAAMLLFLFFEALDSGRDTWKIHLRAARRLIQMSGGMKGIKGGMSSMLSVLITHVAAIDIIGRSLAFSSSESEYQPWGSSLSEVFNSLKEAEDYSILGCPAELLKIILCITLINNQRKNRQQESPFSTLPASTITTDISDKNFIPSAETLLANIHAFSPEAWLRSRFPRLKPQDKRSFPQIDLRELFHHVSAYKCAVHIFAVQVLSPPLPPHTAANQEALTSELISHLSYLSRGSVLYKGAVWPVFIAGTGATSHFQREFVRDALKNIWSVLPQFNIKNAGTLLEEMWRDADREGVGMSGGDWKKRLEKGGIDWLFI